MQVWDPEGKLGIQQWTGDWIRVWYQVFLFDSDSGFSVCLCACVAKLVKMFSEFAAGLCPYMCFRATVHITSHPSQRRVLHEYLYLFRPDLSID